MPFQQKNPRFPTAREDADAAGRCEESPQTTSPSYRLAYADPDFLHLDELRPVRLQLELLKPEITLRDHGIASTVVVFGSARIPPPGEPAPVPDAGDGPAAARARSLETKSTYYAIAREFSRQVSELATRNTDGACVVVTGGGGGIMEAANRGAADAGAESIGLNITLPHEQAPNRWITPELSFQFHYFAVRKLHFLLRAIALAIFPGGFGTLDELFDALTLMQTGKMQRIPVVLFGAGYWRRIIDFEAMVEEGVISPQDLDLIRYAETAEEGMRLVREFYENEGGRA